MGSGIQQYCLRWNNHRSNLLLVFEHLFQTESFTDVTLACDGSSIKCHKMVLAACSSYFQQLFMENDCRHPIVVLKDIKVSEIKAILEYMYKGEVNVAQDQLSGLLKAAETLKVKGLVEDNNHHNHHGNHPHHHATPTPPNQSPYSHATPSNVSSSSCSEYVNNRDATSASSSVYPKSNSVPNTPKYPLPNESPVYEGPYNASSYPDKNSIPFHLWPSSKMPLSPSPKHNSSNYPENSQSEPVPLKKKKFMGTGNGGNGNGSGNGGGKDTPILRTVLGHTSLGSGTNSADSYPNIRDTPPYKSHYMPITTNGPTEHHGIKMRQDSPDHSMDESVRSVESDKVHEEISSFSIEEDSKPGMTPYASAGQKPEWKRYKQYTRNDIMAAIEAVKGGMSALQAARKYGVPSRTLYDKVKKLGITTNRPYRKGSFPMSPYQNMNLKGDDGPSSFREHHNEDTSSYSPEDLPLDISSTGNNDENSSGNQLVIDYPPNGSDGSNDNTGGDGPLVGDGPNGKDGESEGSGGVPCSSECGGPNGKDIGEPPSSSSGTGNPVK